MSSSYNLKNSAVKRILQEAKELAKEQTSEYEAHPLEDNIFEWHFTVTGPDDTDFEGGRYHGRILLPGEYPFKPPHLIFLTPNGRFELNAKICLSITDHHPEFWQPAWGIRTVLLAVMGFFPTNAQGAVGGLDYPKEERQKLAKLSKHWKCTVCQVKNDDFISTSSDSTRPPSTHAKEDLPAFTFTTATEAALKNTSSSSSTVSDIKCTSSTGSGADRSSSSYVKSANPLSPTSISTTTTKNTTNPTASLSRQRVNIPQSQTSSSSPLSTSTLPLRPPPTTSQPSGPPAWLDGLIGICISVLLYLLYQKYM